MSIFSAISAEAHNADLQRRSGDLDEAIRKKDWEAVNKVLKWMRSNPFQE